MFGGGASNLYDDVVAKATDENLTTENWELIMNLCDKVTDEGDEGAHNVITALLKRLAHRSANVQLYALSTTDALSKNCGVAVNKEIASRAFTQSLEKLVVDRTTHDKVRKRVLTLVAQWTDEFQDDPTLGIMEDCYNNLKSKGHRFETPQEPLPPTVDDEIRRKEEEELQRVLEMSMHDRGGRAKWAQYSLASGGPSGAGSSSAAAGSSLKPDANSSTDGGTGGVSSMYTAPKYQGGYVPARSPSPSRQQQQTQHHPSSALPQDHPQSSQQHSSQTSAEDHSSNHPHPDTSSVSVNGIPSALTSVTRSQAGTSTIITRVRALHRFQPTEPGELAFEKNDIIKVVDRGYKDWWRGQLKGRTGIFPVNYVEPMPEPTASELAHEAEQEAAVFAQAVHVEKLLSLLRAFDPAKDNLADNEEIQELYRSGMGLRPRIVKLIDKYSQKRADLVSMNETFVRARTIFERMMEESLARHTGAYDQPTYQPSYPHNPYPISVRPESRTEGLGWYDYQASYVPTASGYPGFGQPGPVGNPRAFPEPQSVFPVTEYHSTPTTTIASAPYGHDSPVIQVPNQQVPNQQVPNQLLIPHQPIQPLQSQQQDSQAQPRPQPQPQPVQQQSQQPTYAQIANAPYAIQGPTPYPVPTQQQQPQFQTGSTLDQPQVQSHHSQAPYQIQPQSQPLIQGQPNLQMGLPDQNQPSQHNEPTVQLQQPSEPQQGSPLTLYTDNQAQSQFQHQEYQVTQNGPGDQMQPVKQPVQQTQPSDPSQPDKQDLQQPQSVQLQPVVQQYQHQPSVQSGPPYIFDRNATYLDSNVQAWAQYYAQGGLDPAGSVYFVSVPGLTGGTITSRPAVTAQGIVGQDRGSGQSGSQSGNVGEGQHRYDYANTQQQLATQSPTSYLSPATQHLAGTSTSPGSTSDLDNNTTLSTLSPGGGTTGAYEPSTKPSPTSASVTPSWVLPRKENLGSSGVQGLTGRFVGVGLADPGSAHA